MDPEQSHKLELANLRLQVSALTEKISAGTLPDQIKSLRRAILLASIAIASALLVSGVLHVIGSSSTKDLERRVELLEKRFAGSGS